MRPPRRRFITVSAAGHAQLSLLTAGPETGPAMVLLHGIPAGAELWREGLSLLADAGLRVFAPDLPGYGGTRLPPSGDRSLVGAAGLIAHWLRQESLPPVWLVGHDLGGAVAQILVVESPELAARLTLTHSPVEASWPPAPIQQLRLAGRSGLYPVLAASGLLGKIPYLAAELRQAVFSPQALTRNGNYQRIFYDSKFTDPQGRREFAAHLAALDNRQTVQVASRLAEIAIPVQLLWGTSDPFQPWERSGRRLQQLLPHAAVQLIPKAGHFAMLDQPEIFYSALLVNPPCSTGLAG